MLIYILPIYKTYQIIQKIIKNKCRFYRILGLKSVGVKSTSVLDEYAKHGPSLLSYVEPN